jgi:N-acetylmuramoyl-L-alanine amidase
MKKGSVIAIIVGLHCLVVGMLFLVQGCRSTPTPEPAPAPVTVMPPPVEPAPPAPPPVVLPPRPVEPPRFEQTKTYVVKQGDSLSYIAHRFNVSTRDIMSLNKISNPNKVRIGQKLTLPGYVDLNAPAPVRKAKKAVVKKVIPVAAGGEYVVKSGDSLSKIAAAHGIKTKDLREANSLTGDKLLIGQKLAIPGGKAAPAEVTPAEVKPGEAAPMAPMEVQAPAAPAESALPVPKANEILHVVEANQDLPSIAMMYGVRAEEIIKLNGLTNAEVKVGQALKIPPPAEL